MRRQQLEIHPAPLDEIPGIALAGEVDIAVAKQVEAALDDGIRASVGAFVLDLCELEFLDSSGVSLIMRARALLGARGARARRRSARPARCSASSRSPASWICSRSSSSRDAATEALVPADPT